MEAAVLLTMNEFHRDRSLSECVMRLRLKELRTARGMTQRQVADQAGMSVSYYTEIEGGKKQINANRMDAIARALRVSPSELILDPRKEADSELLALLSSLDETKRDLLLDLARKLAGH
jgi:transcriptional regulator with XRE-family HTH domain